MLVRVYDGDRDSCNSGDVITAVTEGCDCIKGGCGENSTGILKEVLVKVLKFLVGSN